MFYLDAIVKLECNR